ncbi:MAG: glycosyltransferase family 2 protein [Bacteroidales bacterium]|nr:glycosyltransferase family 2 protein [Bacteroidales bacterium]
MSMELNMRKGVDEKTSNISVVIITFNEEKNLPYALKSIQDISDDIHVVDSESTDRTKEIAKQFGANFYTNGWVNWAVQRNWAQDNCRLKNEWILYLDADEQLTDDSRREIFDTIHRQGSRQIGYYLQFEFWFLGKRIRNAMNPHLRLIYAPKVRWSGVGAREYCSAPADSPVIKAHLIHDDHRGIKFWSQKSIRNAEMEARHLFDKKHGDASDSGRGEGEETSLKRKLRDHLDSYSPPIIRAFVVFLFRLLFKTDLRDGWAGFTYTLFFGLWYPLLVDAIYIEMCMEKLKQEK